MIDKLNIIITIIAAVIMTAVCLALNYSLDKSALILILTIVGFFVLGSIVQVYLRTKVLLPPTPADAGEEETSEEETGGEESEEETGEESEETETGETTETDEENGESEED